MRDFVTVLSGFFQATKTLSDESSESASIILPLFYSLRNWLTEKASAKSLAQVETPEGKVLKSALLKSLDFYMNKYGFFENKLLKAITYLDPRF